LEEISTQYGHITSVNVKVGNCMRISKEALATLSSVCEGKEK
jgi:hypothetical protein